MRKVSWLACLCTLAFALAACDSDDGGGSGFPQTDSRSDEDGVGGDTAGTGDDATPGPDTFEPTTCTGDADCAGVATGACRSATCGSEGVCVIGDVPDGSPCDADACFDGQTCTDGACGGGTEVPAQCEGLECGDDGCGNSCGTCGEGETCGADGQCSGGEPTWSCDELAFEGCCTDAGAVVWCEEGEVQQLDCFEDGGTCGWNGENEFFDCAAEETPDPAGALPYLCPGEACSESCDDRACGFACGESCGTCGEGEACSPDGQCVACGCEDKQCGDDGCGNSCGTCGEGEFCDASQCAACSCDGLECGTDECGESCGTCGEGEACSADGQCIVDPCEGVTVVGCCDGSTVKFCAEGALEEEACESSCGWDPAGADGQGWYDCEASGADPSGQFPLECPGTDPPPPVDEGDEQPEFVEPVPDVVEDTADVQDSEVLDPETIEDIDVGPTPDEGPTPDTGPDATDTVDETSAPDATDTVDEISAPDTTTDTVDETSAPDTTTDTSEWALEGACTNDPDQTALKEAGAMDELVAACALQCEGAVSCVQTCVESEAGLSTECAGCYTDIVVCATDECPSCVESAFSSDPCLACAEANCLGGIPTCTGY